MLLLLQAEYPWRRASAILCHELAETDRGQGKLRHQFVHAWDLTPTLLDLIGISAPTEIGGVAQMPIEGESFARSITDPSARSKTSPQYFEMFGHR